MELENQSITLHGTDIVSLFIQGNAIQGHEIANIKNASEIPEEFFQSPDSLTSYLQGRGIRIRIENTNFGEFLVREWSDVLQDKYNMTVSVSSVEPWQAKWLSSLKDYKDSWSDCKVIHWKVSNTEMWGVHLVKYDEKKDVLLCLQTHCKLLRYSRDFGREEYKRLGYFDISGQPRYSTEVFALLSTLLGFSRILNNAEIYNFSRNFTLDMSHTVPYATHGQSLPDDRFFLHWRNVVKCGGCGGKLLESEAKVVGSSGKKVHFFCNNCFSVPTSCCGITMSYPQKISGHTCWTKLGQKPNFVYPVNGREIVNTDAIERILRSQFRESVPATRRSRMDALRFSEFVVHETGSDFRDERGTKYKKRLGKAISLWNRSHDKITLSTESHAEIDSVLSEIVRISGNIMHFDQIPYYYEKKYSVYGDTNSCWMSGGCNSNAGQLLNEDSNASVLLFEGEGGGSRAWMYEFGDKKVLFNSRGQHSLREMGLMYMQATGEDLHLAEGDLSCDHQSVDIEDVIWLVPETSQYSQDDSLPWEGGYEYSCHFCGDGLHEEEAYCSDHVDDYLCEGCWYNAEELTCEFCLESLSHGDYDEHVGECEDKETCYHCNVRTDDFVFVEEIGEALCSSCKSNSCDICFEVAPESGNRECTECDAKVCGRCRNRGVNSETVCDKCCDDYNEDYTCFECDKVDYHTVIYRRDVEYGDLLERKLCDECHTDVTTKREEESKSDK